MEIIARKMEVAKENVDAYSDSYSIQFSYNSDGRMALRIKVNGVDEEDILIVLNKTETDNLFKFVRKIKEVKE
ncbi:hypothetical protein [Ferrimicrobium sp.]|uniref:hypothetical protein n=1 Tax=Ferrimicrobium sp. TaxID=2926050 RepID=UPI0026207F79|nr:hypothetical protein [Ferrimicrobium sp.]